MEDRCDRSNNLLKVHFDPLPGDAAEKTEFGVCVKGLDLGHADLTARIAEWLEFQFILGNVTRIIIMCSILCM